MPARPVPPTEAAEPHDAPVERSRPDAPLAKREIGGRKDGSEPTRFGDWEKHGRCIDF